MSTSASAVIVVGVSYINLLESDDIDFEEVLDEAVGEIGDTDIRVHTEIRCFDTPTDVFIGVVFFERPTDAQVEEATTKVRCILPRLRELVGHEPSSGVETWLSASVD